MAGLFLNAKPVPGITDNGDAATRPVPRFGIKERPKQTYGGRRTLPIAGTARARVPAPLHRRFHSRAAAGGSHEQPDLSRRSA